MKNQRKRRRRYETVHQFVGNRVQKQETKHVDRLDQVFFRRSVANASGSKSLPWGKARMGSRRVGDILLIDCTNLLRCLLSRLK